ncbi:MAG: efflux transporter periplasmic adaptor subunit [Opitutia bacterium Tous-C1TDCM]|nr:MAG: efflux transporter periplasmic adaptor subunit [Opitutae bacterium Tous-C1TDCM]
MSMNAPAAKSAAKSSRTVWYVVGGLLVLALLGGGAYFKAKSADKSVVVTAEKAVTKTITQLVNATGKIQPEVEVKIAPEVSGEIVELPLREGAVVKKGDLLVKIKPDNYRYQLDQREADLAAARASSMQSKAQLVKLQEDLKRTSELFAKKLVSDSDLTAGKTSVEAAQAGFENSLAQIRRQEGLLSQAKDQLEKTVIFSPMDGTVSSRTSEVGERVAATGQFNAAEVMRVADLSRMEVRVNVNENDVVNVKVGDKARVSIDAYPNRKFTGAVREIASAAKTQGLNTQEEVTNFQVKISIADKDVALRPGMSASVDIETKTVEGVVAVPIQAVTVRSREGSKTIEQLSQDREKKSKENQGEGAAAAVNEKQQREREKADRDALQRVVFLKQGETVKMVTVETGISDTSHLEIKAGLKAGDEVVSGPFSVITRTLKDGAKVRLEKPKKKDEEKK